MSPESLADQLKQMSLQPAALDRDRLLFEAGRRSVKPSKAWPLATVTSMALACTMTVLYWQQTQQPQQPMLAVATQAEPVQTLPEIKEVPTVTEPEPQVPYMYLVLRDPSILNKPISYPNNHAKPTPLLTAGSYLQPDWQR
jgi:hypothetical protein